MSDIGYVERLTVADVERAIGEPAKSWVARCHEIASAIVDARLVRGDAVYGHWIGPVNPKSYFADRRRLPFIRHGWIVLENNTHVLDPTRWVFEARKPYLYVGQEPDAVAPGCENCGLLIEEHGRIPDACSDYRLPPPWPYDEGGDRWRQAAQQPCPAKKPGDVQHDLNLPASVKRGLGIPMRPTSAQLVWLANLPYAMLDVDAWDVCQALDRLGRKPCVPIDTWNRARREHRWRTKK